MSDTNNADKPKAKQIKDGDRVDGQRVVFLLLDTSWRVAVPIIVLSLLGHYIDQRTGHRTLFLLLGFFASLVVAMLLVYRQLCIVFPDQFGKNKLKGNKEK